MKLRYIIDIDTDKSNTKMECQLANDIKDFIENHEYGCLANSIDVKLQDEFCIKHDQDIIKKLKKENSILKQETETFYVKVKNLINHKEGI